MEEITDEELTRLFTSLDTRIATINERTKIHTIDIRELRKQIKELKGK